MLPVLVVQVPDAPTEADLATIVSTIETEWDRGLSSNATVHVFGEHETVVIDFVIVSRRDDGELIASFVDPHGDHLADALPKLRALCDYADQHGDRYARIESVAKDSDGSLWKLSLHEAPVRDAVRGFLGAWVTPLYDDPQVAKPYL